MDMGKGYTSVHGMAYSTVVSWSVYVSRSAFQKHDSAFHAEYYIHTQSVLPLSGTYLTAGEFH